MIKLNTKGVPIYAWTEGVQFEDAARAQVEAVAALPIIYDHVRDTAGVECRKDAAVVDETPRAYKDLDAVMAAQTDLVAVLHELRAVLCVKG